MPRNNRNESTVASTMAPLRNHSCAVCFNQKIDPMDDSPAPRRRYGTYISLPIYLVDSDGTFVDVCYKAQCPDCGDIRKYTLSNGRIVPGIYKLSYDKYGRMFADWRVERWDELRKRNLDPKGFVEAVLMHPKERYFEVANLPKFVSTRHRAEFYEPKQERCTLL